MADIDKNLISNPEPVGGRTAAPADLLTVAAMAAVIYCLSVMLHEAGGHGGACLAVGAKPVAWGAFYFDCDTRLGPAWKWRVVAGAGNTVNLIVAMLAGLALRATRSDRSTTRLALTMLLAVNLFTWAGYFLFSGATGIGDWGDAEEAVLWRVPNAAIWRAVEFAFGVAAYLFAIRLVGRQLGAIFGGGPGSRKAARLTAWTTYFTGSVLSLLIGLLNPVGVIITLASGAASSFGGTAGFWSAHMFVRQDGSNAASPIRRSWGWIAAGMLVASGYAAILGHSIKLG